MLADDQEPEIPIYYVLNKSVRDSEGVLATLRMTPIDAAIVTDWLDYDFACQICDVVAVTSPDQVTKIREMLNRPVLLLGEADFLDAVYADGRRESIAAHA